MAKNGKRVSKKEMLAEEAADAAAGEEEGGGGGGGKVSSGTVDAGDITSNGGGDPKETTTGTVEAADDKETLENGVEEEEDGPQSVWDMIRVLEAADGAIPCRMDGCDRRAVSVWKDLATLSDDDFPICEPCQEVEFGGWPVDSVKDQEGAATAPAVPVGTPKADLSEGSKSLPTVDKDTAPISAVETKGDDDEVETWELKKILSIADVTGDSIVLCKTEGCGLPACCVYVSNKDSTNWYSCLDCQVRFYYSPRARYYQWNLSNNLATFSPPTLCRTSN